MATTAAAATTATLLNLRPLLGRDSRLALQLHGFSIGVLKQGHVGVSGIWSSVKGFGMHQRVLAQPRPEQTESEFWTLKPETDSEPDPIHP